MKTKLWAILLTAFVLFAVIGAATAEQMETGETYTMPSFEIDGFSTKPNKTLLYEYANRVLYSRPMTKGTMAGDNLKGADKNAYDKLRPLIAEVADGKRASTVFTFPVEEIYPRVHFTFSEFGFAPGTNSQEFWNALWPKIWLRDCMAALNWDCPYEMYWQEGLKGCKISGIQWKRIAEDTLKMEGNVTISVYVTPTYGTGNNEFTVNTALGQTVQRAMANARQIVADNAGKGDREKFTAYKDKICELVNYNHAAVNDSVAYNNSNPYQIIWVFDGDPSTDVVCNGYAKAFQYLCDLSTFSDSKTKGLYVGGYVNDDPSAGHAWNVVTLNGLHYLVDCTFCDGGANNFLLSASSGNYKDGYTFVDSNGNTTKYTYDASVIKRFPANELIIYNPVNYEWENETPVRHLLTINYRYDANDPYMDSLLAGTIAAAWYSDQLEEGEDYSVTSPDVPHCVPDREVVFGSMGTQNIEITVYYKAITHRLTINYQLENGQAVSAPYSALVAEGANYSVESPVIANYTPDKSYVSGIMGDQDLTVTVIYKPNGQPGTPTPAPGPTTPAPGPTTPAPGPTTPAPGPTTPAPGPTTPAPGPTTPAPGPTDPTPSPVNPEEPPVNEAVVSGALYRLDHGKKTAVLMKVNDKSIKKLTVPAAIKANGKSYKVTAIADKACKGLKNLASVTIGNNVKSIGKDAFASCKKLTTAVIGKGTASIGKSAFASCKKLKSIRILSAKLTRGGIGAGCFKGIPKAATFRCPKKMLNKYAEWLVKIGKAPKTCSFVR